MYKKRKIIKQLSICVSFMLMVSLLSGVSASAKGPVINETSYYYEAESGKLYGTAKVNEEASASGGKYVSELNFNHSKYDITNKVAFSLKKIKYPGRYKVSLYYSSGTSGNVILSVNGRKQSVSYGATGGWEWNRKAVSANIELKGNKKDKLIISDGPSGYMWLDAIRVTYIGKPSIIKNPTKKNRYEAEDATIGKLAYAKSNGDASGGAYVHELNYAGAGSSKQGYVQFDKLKIKKAGTYKMTLHFNSAADGRTYAYVNNAKYPYYKDYKTTHLDDWGTWKKQTVTMKIYLKGNGKDKIKIHDRVGYMWLDYMTLKYVSSKKTEPKAFVDNDGSDASRNKVTYTVRKEAEEAILTKDVNIGSNGKASGGAFINNLNYSADATKQGSVTFTELGASQEGTYRIRMAYNSAANGKIWVIVNNNGKAYEGSYESTHNGDWGTWITQYLTIDIPLTGKNDTITIYNREGYMWLDYIEIGRLDSAESSKTTSVTSAPAVSGGSGSGNTGGNSATLEDYNGGFEASHKYWTFVGNHAGINSDDPYYKAKVYFYSSDAFEQSMYSNIQVPNGYYYVQAKTKQSIGEPEVCQMQVSGYNGSDTEVTDISRSNAYITTKSNVFEVKDGKMTITFYEKADTSANLQIDNVVIVPLSQQPAEEESVNRMDEHNGTFDEYTEGTNTSYALAATEWEFAEATLYADHKKNGTTPEIFTVRKDDHIRLSRGVEWVWIDCIELKNTEDSTVYRIEAEDYVSTQSNASIAQDKGVTYVYSDSADDTLAEIPTAEAQIPEGTYTMTIWYVHQGADSAVDVVTDGSESGQTLVEFQQWEADYGSLGAAAAGGAVDKGRYATLTSNGSQVVLSQKRSGFVPGSTYHVGAWVKSVEGDPAIFRLNGLDVIPEDDWKYIETAGVVSNNGKLSISFQLDGVGEKAAVAVDEVVLYGELGEYTPQTYHFEAENYAVSKIGETSGGVKYAYADKEHDQLVEIPLTDVVEGAYTVKIHYSYYGTDTWVNLVVASSDDWYQVAGTSQTEWDVFDDYTFTAGSSAVKVELTESDTLKIYRGGEWIWIDYIELIPQ